MRIVEEANRVQFNIKSTAQKYDVFPEQIRRWKNRYDEEFNSNKITGSLMRVIYTIIKYQSISRRLTKEELSRLWTIVFVLQ